MTDKEVLQKAIEIAIKNKWMDGYTDWNIFSVNDSPFPLGGYYINFHRASPFEYGMSVNDIIFSHDFAKAFFGDGENMNREFDDFGSPTYRYSCGSFFNKPEWQYHLQNMVLHKNPIDYLRIFTE